jgi:integrase
MPRQLHRLSARAVATLKTPGRHSDGGGLVLHVDDAGRRRWVYRFKWSGRVRDMGLGACPPVTLADAREAADQARRVLAKGLDPIAERAKVKADATPVSFRKAADELLATFNASWRNAKHRQQWANTLETYCAGIMSRPVADITTSDVLGILKPLWQTKPETASRLRGRIERVLALARVRGWRTGENPAQWRNHLDQLLPAPKKLSRGHHRALPFADVPAFVKKLRETETVANLALEFVILTGVRTSEATGARWEEFDMPARLWTVPGERMKAGKPHRVPLAPRAVEIVERMAQAKLGDFVFPGRMVRGKAGPLSSMAMSMVLRRAKVDATTHGFRSSLRDWISETTNFPHEVAEQALAHTISSAVEKSYRRGDLLEKRRAMMEQWAQFIDVPPAGKVVSFGRVEG